MYNRNLVIIGIYLFTIYLHSTNGDANDSKPLYVHTESSEWKKGFDECGTFGGAQVFNYCQPDTCNASRAQSKIENLIPRGRGQYWINGYVLRSPVLFNKGCFSLRSSEEGVFSFDDNSPFTCSRACPNADYIFLREKECLCFPENNYTYMESNNFIEEKSMSKCDIYCPGRKYDKCGEHSYDDDRGAYSVYEILNRKISQTEFSETCSLINLANRTFGYGICLMDLNYICRYYNTTTKRYKTTCSNNSTTWLDAQQECQLEGKQLSDKDKNTKCISETGLYWIGHYLQEKIVWGNRSVPEDAVCLTLVVNEQKNEYKLETKECTTKYGFLCSTVHTENEDEGSGVTTDEEEGSGVTTLSSNTGVKTSTVDSQITGKPSTKSIVPNQENNLVPVVAGVVGGLVLTIIIVIIIVLVRRKRSSACQEKSFVPTRSYDYSEPRVNYSSEEQNKLINVTEEGVYNHLGDTDKITETKSASSVYDIMGKAENEYDISEATGKRQNIDEKNDLYDHSRGDELYDSTTENPTRSQPDSNDYSSVLNT